MHSTSAGLLEQLKDPNPGDAWHRMVSIYGPLIFLWAKAKRLSAEDAADLMQDVFLTLTRELTDWQYDPNRSFRGWLRTIVERRAIDLLRKNAKHRADTAFDVEQLISDESSDLFVEHEFRQHVIRTAFESISHEFQPAIWQAAYRQLVLNQPARQVAEELQLTLNSVYLAKSRVLARLRRVLTELPGD